MGWDKVEHFQCGPESKAKEEFALEGVPHVVLVDTEGKIVFVGHPSERDLEADINTLLKGEQLTMKKEVESADSAPEQQDPTAAIKVWSSEAKNFME